MKLRKELITHFSFTVSFFVIITIFRRWFDLYYLPFWIGGILGTIMPDLDQLIYIYFLKPTETGSQRITAMLDRRDVMGALKSLSEARYQRNKLIFHTAQFQLIFLVLTFFVISSSGNYFGWGIVLAFSLHLLIDEVVDLMETKGLKNWFTELPIELDKEQRRWYLVVNFLILLVLGLLM